MKHIHVHLGPMPEMLRTIISDLLRREPDIVISGQSSAPELLTKLRRERVDVLIAQEEADGGCLDLILGDVPPDILALATDGRAAAAVRLVRQTISLECEGRSILAQAIRQMAAELRPRQRASQASSAVKARH